MYKSYKPALSLLLIASACLGTAGAQEVGTPAPAEKKPKHGYIRFWNMLPKGSGPLLLQQKGAAPDAAPIATAEPLNYYASYEPVAPAKYALSVVRAGNTSAPLQQFNLLLRSDVYVTFLAREVNGKPTVEMLDDTYDPAAVTAGRITIRNHFPDAQVTVTGDASIQSRLLSCGDFQVLDGFPLRPVLLEMQAKLPNGKTQRWSAEVDFRSSKRATLLVMADPYGRFRPRVSADGPNLLPAIPAATAQR